MDKTGSPGLNTLFISGLDGDTRRYRCFHQQEQLALVGVHSGFRESDDPRLLVDALDFDVFILHRVPLNPLINALIDLVHLRGKPVVFETDDLVIAPELYDQIGYADSLSPEAARRFRDELDQLAETFQRCDCALTTTQFLADEVSRRGKPTYVHRNAPSEEMFRISEEAFAARSKRLDAAQRQGGPVTVGYFSGTGSHNRDFRAIKDALIWALETYPQLRIHVSGHLDLPRELAPYEHRISRAPYVTWRELPHLIADVDINLSPLEQDNPFCRGKSENKFVEAALVGVPTIASRVDAFEYAIDHGQDGFLASTADEWVHSLQTLLDDPHVRRAMGEAARRSVYARYQPKQSANHLLDTLASIADRFGIDPASPEQLLRRFADGIGEYLDQMRDESRGLHLQLRDLRRATAEREERNAFFVAQMEQQQAGLIEQIEERDRTIEAIMQGRVMRAMTRIQLWFRSFRR
jgi:glycosyltransferase involved in cell wall biosynthesis